VAGEGYPIDPSLYGERFYAEGHTAEFSPNGKLLVVASVMAAAIYEVVLPDEVERFMATPK
jgi:hypothetical protein